MMPLLTIYAMFVGILGGLLVAVTCWTSPSPSSSAAC
jgi:ABC-type transporter Mla maintaining outer membrane lipid asymmetry permease subunit MlaE